MSFKNRTNWPIALIFTAVILSLVACDGNGRTLVYRADGTAAEAKVVYTDADGNTQEETVTLPWETSFEISQEFKFELRVSNTQPTGKIKCEVRLDDSKRGDKSSAAYAVCMGSVKLDGDSTSGSFVSYNAEGDLKEASELVKKGESEKALSKIEGVLNNAPNFADAYFVQGLAYKNMEELDRAIAAYGQAITLDPDYVHAYNNRGLAYQQAGERDLAVADFTSALEVDPAYVTGYFNRAVILASMGDLKAARADVVKVQELTDDPEIRAWAEKALAQLDGAN